MQPVEVLRFPTAAPTTSPASRDRSTPKRNTGGRHRCGPRQDRGQRLRQRLHPRGFATASYAGLLAARLRTTPAEVEQRVQFIMSGGTEGIMTPHVSVFVRRDVPAGGRPGKGLVAGIASTRAIEPEELGTTAHVREVALAVRAGMRDAGIDRRRRRALRADQVSAPDGRGDHRGDDGRQACRDDQHLRIDGVLARRRRARGCA